MIQLRRTKFWSTGHTIIERGEVVRPFHSHIRRMYDLCADDERMRRFIILGHDVPIDPSFSLDDIPGTAGRLDILCRCLSAAFLLSHGIRTDVRVYLILRDTITLRFEGSMLKHLRPDERSTAASIRNALSRKSEAVGHQEFESSPGLFLSRKDLHTVLREIDGPVVQLHEDGDPIDELSPPEAPIFVVSDHRDFSSTDQKILSSNNPETVCLSPYAIHADHAITIAHSWIDTNGFSRFRSSED